MSFMQKQITNKQAWVRVDTSCGTECLDASLLGLNIRDSRTNTHPLTAKERERIVSQLSPYVEGTVQEWETVRGYGARLSAPDYLDCTEWVVFDTPEEAEAYLNETFGDNED